jgi:hypothetical protein
MKRLVLAAITASAMWAFLDGQRLQAQQPVTRPQTSPFFNPPVSPFLSLRSGFGNPAVNYFNITQPQFATGNALLQLQNQAGFLQLQQQGLLTGAGIYNPALSGGLFNPGLYNSALLNSGLLTPGLATPGLTPTTSLGGFTTGHPVLYNSYSPWYTSNPVRPVINR